jgi:hypothetical protein
MTLLYCTQKLLDHLGVQAIESAPPHDIPEPRLGHWYAKLVRLARRNGVLFTSARTMLSFVVPAPPARRAEQLSARFRQGLGDVLAQQGYSLPVVRSVLAEYEPQIVYARATDRAITGTMNAMAQDAEILLRVRGGWEVVSPRDLADAFNQSPWRILGYDRAVDRVAAILADNIQSLDF